MDEGVYPKGTAVVNSHGQTLTGSDGQVLACAYGRCIGNAGPTDVEQNVGNYLRGAAPDGPLIDLLQGQTEDAWDELAHGCEKDEPEVCGSLKTGTVEVGFGSSLLGRAATSATSKQLAARVEVLFAKGIAGKKRSALAGMLELEGKAPQLLLATSGKHEQTGLVPLVGGSGNPARYKAIATGRNARTNDTEYKMLTYIANQLGDPSSIKGSLTLHSSQAACMSCTTVVGQFIEEFPNIRINYTSGRP
ncbi:deaminase domain-containing protein [Streptomyces chartreusis]|uniref:deaminase domain-containing protein n=1 Tax=Streptomyces chartreusis TaxID=1969 RepID=UPI00386F3E0D